MVRILLFIVISVAMISALAGCNLWGWTSQPTSAGDFMNEGRQKLNDGDYSGAMEDFRRAIEEQPCNSDARFAYSKARILSVGINPLDVLASLSRFNLSGDNVLIPFFDTTAGNWPDISATTLYNALEDVSNVLQPVFMQQTCGSLTRSDVGIDYGISRIVYAFMKMRDSNFDRLIRAAQDHSFRMVWLGGRFRAEGLAEIYSMHGGINGSGANDVNSVLDLTSTTARDLVTIVRDILPDTTGASFGNLANTAEHIATSISEYRIADARDNDGDNWVDEMVFGIDSLRFYFDANRNIRAQFIPVVQRLAQSSRDAAGSALDNPMPWTPQWVTAMNSSRPGYIDSLYAARPVNP